LQVN